MTEHEYAFDVTFKAVVRVTASGALTAAAKVTSINGFDPATLEEGVRITEISCSRLEISEVDGADIDVVFREAEEDNNDQNI